MKFIPWQYPMVAFLEAKARRTFLKEEMSSYVGASSSISVKVLGKSTSI